MHWYNYLVMAVVLFGIFVLLYIALRPLFGKEIQEIKSRYPHLYRN